MRVAKFVKSELEDYGRKGYGVLEMSGKDDKYILDLVEDLKVDHYVQPGYIMNKDCDRVPFILLKKKINKEDDKNE